MVTLGVALVLLGGKKLRVECLLDINGILVVLWEMTNSLLQ